MNKRVWFTCLLIITFSASHSYAQSTGYQPLINNGYPGYKITRNEKDYKSRQIYLGAIRSREGKIIYHVISDFTCVRAAIVMHGNSSLFFLNPNGKIVGEYHLNMPDELPYKLLNNKLYFKSEESNSKIKTVLISDKLPKFLCAYDCYRFENWK